MHTIVNNESSEIIRIFNTAFNEFVPTEKAALNYYPEEHRAEIDALNDLIYPNINSERYQLAFFHIAYHKRGQTVFIDQDLQAHRKRTNLL